MTGPPKLPEEGAPAYKLPRGVRRRVFRQAVRDSGRARKGYATKPRIFQSTSSNLSSHAIYFSFLSMISEIQRGGGADSGRSVICDWLRTLPAERMRDSPAAVDPGTARAWVPD